MWVPGAFPRGKGGRCVRLTTLPPSCAVVMKSGNLILETCGPVQACNRTAYCAVQFDHISTLPRHRRCKSLSNIDERLKIRPCSKETLCLSDVSQPGACIGMSQVRSEGTTAGHKLQSEHTHVHSTSRHMKPATQHSTNLSSDAVATWSLPALQRTSLAVFSICAVDTLKYHYVPNSC